MGVNHPAGFTQKLKLPVGILKPIWRINWFEVAENRCVAAGRHSRQYLNSLYGE